MLSVTNDQMKASFKCWQAESMKCEVSGDQRKEIKKNKQTKYKTTKLRNYWSGLRDLLGNFSSRPLKDFCVSLLRSCWWYAGHMFLIWRREDVSNQLFTLPLTHQGEPCNLRWTPLSCSPPCTHSCTNIGANTSLVNRTKRRILALRLQKILCLCVSQYTGSSLWCRRLCCGKLYSMYDVRDTPQYSSFSAAQINTVVLFNQKITSRRTSLCFAAKQS